MSDDGKIRYSLSYGRLEGRRVEGWEAASRGWRAGFVVAVIGWVLTVVAFSVWLVGGI